MTGKHTNAGKVLGDLTAAEICEDFCGSQIPPVEKLTGEFLSTQLKFTFLSGLWTGLQLAERCRDEPPDRAHALLNHISQGAEAELLRMSGDSNMSWSITGSGKRDAAASRIQEQAAGLTYLTGKEADLKEKAIDLALQVINANDADANISDSLHGSAYIIDGNQKTQSIGISVTATI